MKHADALSTAETKAACKEIAAILKSTTEGLVSVERKLRVINSPKELIDVARKASAAAIELHCAAEDHVKKRYPADVGLGDAFTIKLLEFNCEMLSDGEGV